MSGIALSPVSVGVYTLLNVSGLTALAPGGVSDDPAQGTAFPFVWYEVSEREVGGYGSNTLPEVDLRVHCFGNTTVAQVQGVAAKVRDLLDNLTISATGWTQCGKVFYDGTQAFPDEQLNGVRVIELVAQFRIYVEQ